MKTTSSPDRAPGPSSQGGRTVVIPEPIFRFGLSPAAFVLYGVLLLHRNKNTGLAWPKWKTMRELSGVGKDTIKKKLLELEGHGLIQNRGRKGRVGSVRYFIPIGEIPKSPNSMGPSDSEKSESWESENSEFSDSRNSESWESEKPKCNQNNRTREERTIKKETSDPSSKSSRNPTTSRDSTEGGGSSSDSDIASEGNSQSNSGADESWEPDVILKRLARIFDFDGPWTKREREAYSAGLAGLNGHGPISDADLDLLGRWSSEAPNAQLEDFPTYLRRIGDQLKRAARWSARQARAKQAPGSGGYQKGETLEL